MVDVTAQDAKAHGLPPVHMRVDTAGSALSVTPFPEADKYLIASGPPGTALLVIVWPSDDRDRDAAAVERAVRRQFAQPWHQPLVIGEAATIAVAGGDRVALAFTTGEAGRRTAWCGVL